MESVHRLWHVIALRLLLKAINFSQDQFTMLEHMFKCPFEMAQQVSREPGVVPAVAPFARPALSEQRYAPALQQCADWPVQGGGVPSLAALQARTDQRIHILTPREQVAHVCASARVTPRRLEAIGP